MSATGSGQELTRRGVLGALPLAATAALTSCSWTRSVRDPGSSTGADAADDALRGSVAESEQGLLIAYDQAILAHPSIAATLAVLRTHHAEHASRLGSPTTGVEAPGASGSPGAHGGRSPATGSTVAGFAAARPVTAPPSLSGPTADRATSQQATVAALVRLEQQAAALLRAKCLVAAAGLAPLLASIHAAELAHADLLAPLAR